MKRVFISALFLFLVLGCSGQGDGTCPDERPEPVVLYSGLEAPQHVAARGGTVYWTEGSRVMAGSACGGAPVLLAEGQNNPSRIVSDEEFVYFANDNTSGEVKRVPMGGGAIETLASGQFLVRDLATDNDRVYFTTNNQIMAVRKDGGSPSALATGELDPTGIAVDEENIFWINAGTETTGGTIRKMAKSGGRPTTIEELGPSTSGTSDHLVLDETRGYWGRFDSHQLRWFSKRGGEAGVLFGDGESDLVPVDLVLRDGELFFTAYPNMGDGVVMRIGTRGEKQAKLAMLPGRRPQGLAVSEAHVFWVVVDPGDRSGAIMRLMR